jgi:hypothetical protein
MRRQSCGFSTSALPDRIRSMGESCFTMGEFQCSGNLVAIRENSESEGQFELMAMDIHSRITNISSSTLPPRPF